MQSEPVSIAAASELIGDEELNITDRPFALLLKLYGQHPQVSRALHDLKNSKQATKSALDMTGRYLQEIGQYDLLDAFDEQVLFRELETGMGVLSQLEDGKELSEAEEEALIRATIAYQTVYLSNLRLVVNIAKKYIGFNMPLLDIVQEGSIGLAKGIARFDIDKGFKFSTFATSWVRQQITRGIADKSRNIRLPVHNHEKWIKLRMQINDLELELAREATSDEIADYTGLSVKQVNTLLVVGSILQVSLNAPLGEDGGEFGDLLADELSLGEDERMISAIMMREEISDIFLNCDLDRREKFVLSFRFGLDLPEMHGTMVEDVQYGEHSAYDHTRTLDEVGAIFHLTRERVRQIEKKALGKIREKIDSGLVDISLFDLT